MAKDDVFKKLDDLDKNERSLLLYFETCLVDSNGKVDQRRLNDADRAIAERWKDEGFINYGRIAFKDINVKADPWQLTARETHYVRFSGEAWKLAHQERRNRSDRILAKVSYEMVT